MGKKKKVVKKTGDSLINVIPSALVGCHLINESTPWILGCDKIDADEYAAAPDLSIDPEDGLLSFINKSNVTKSFYFSTYNSLFKEDGSTLPSSTSRDEHNTIHPCTTLIANVPPSSIMDICFFDPSIPTDSLQIFSDIQILPPSPPSLTGTPLSPATLPSIRFPFNGERFECSQGHNANFTHFFDGNRYAVDFTNSVGQPILAGGDGEIVLIKDSNCVSGINVENLFKWNSVLIRLDSGKYVEYVHIAKGSVQGEVGTRIRQGDVVCLGGDVGFCPHPHVHIQMYDSMDDAAVSIPFAFETDSGEKFIPTAGNWYNGVSGLISL